MTKPIDYAAQRYGRLRPSAFAFMRETEGGQRKNYWLCKCDCGEEIIVSVASLQSGDTRSCGCLRREAVAAKNTKHGQSRSAEHRAWCEMKRRCLNPRSKSFHNYGGRGISICPRWIESFENFLADLGPRPTSQHSIDRINVNGNYEPDNCRWATSAEQYSDLRKSVHVEVNGIRKTVAEWARLTGINPYTIYDRIDAGWDPVRAVSEKPRS